MRVLSGVSRITAIRVPAGIATVAGSHAGGAVGSAGASLAWQFAGWAPVCTFGAALVAIASGLHACARVAEKRVL